MDGYRRTGTTLKVNMALRGLPRFRCLPEDRGQFGSTMHLLPDEGEVMASLTRSFADVQAGRLPEFPTIEWYIHTTVDPSMRDAAGHHNSALFVQWVPHTLAGTTWEAEEERYVRHLLSICDRFAPGTSDLVVDTFPLHPRKIEAHFGITGGTHPPRGQHLRLLGPAPVRAAGGRAVLGERGLPSGGVGHRGGGAQRRASRPA